MRDMLTVLGRLLGKALEQIRTRQVRTAYESLLDELTLAQQEASSGVDEEQIARTFAGRFFSVDYFAVIDVVRAESDDGFQIVAIHSVRPELSDPFAGRIISRPADGPRAMESVLSQGDVSSLRADVPVRSRR